VPASAAGRAEEPADEPPARVVDFAAGLRAQARAAELAAGLRAREFPDARPGLARFADEPLPAGEPAKTGWPEEQPPEIEALRFVAEPPDELAAHRGAMAVASPARAQGAFAAAAGARLQARQEGVGLPLPDAGRARRILAA
jgi:hypothetical protein